MPRITPRLYRAVATLVTVHYWRAKLDELTAAVERVRRWVALMSGMGQKRTFMGLSPMSAIGGKADSGGQASECPVLAKTGHSLIHRVFPGVLGPDRLGAGL